LRRIEDRVEAAKASGDEAALARLKRRVERIITARAGLVLPNS